MMIKQGLFTLCLLCTFTSAHALDLGKGRSGDMFFVHHAPDPVNTRTGNFFLPLQDYYMPCFNYPLEVYRSYNSFSTKNGPFGHGWTFNYDIQIMVGKSDGLKVVEADGYVNEYTPVENKYQSQKDIVAQIINEKKAEDIKYSKNKSGKGQAHYDKMEKRLLNEPAYYANLKKRYIKTSSISASGSYISQNRGTSYLTQKGNRFIRENEIGQKETYNEKGLLVSIEDRNDNILRFSYDSLSRLHRIYDDCANHIQISYNKNNKIASIQDTFQRSLRYDYDATLRLTSFTGIDQKTMKYGYDTFNRMTSVTFEDGTQTIINYSKNGQVQSQQGPGSKYSAFAYGKDGNAIWTKVTENKKDTSEYRYIDIDNTIIHKGSDGVTTTTVLSSCCGKPISIKSSNGINDVFVYDKDGNLASRTNAAGETITFEYEPRFKSIANITESNGRVLRYRYDRKGNLIFAQSIEPLGSKRPLAENGTSVGNLIIVAPLITLFTPPALASQTLVKKHLKLSYEPHGKIKHMVDHLGTEIYFDYSKLGKNSQIIKKVDGKIRAQIGFTFDAKGELTQTSFFPNKLTTPKEIQSTLQNFMLLLEPTGIDFEI